MTSQELMKKTFAEVLDGAAETIEDFPWHDRKAYCHWLSQTYYLVRHTSRLLCLAAGQTLIDDDATHHAFIQHLKEELRHDLPLLKDLKALGHTPSEFEELPETQLLINNQYFWLNSGHAHALQGYALLLEGLSLHCIPHMKSELEKAGFGHATSFIKLHYESDETHYPEGLERASLLTASSHPEILANLKQSAFLYRSIYERVAVLSRAEIRKSA